MLSSRKLPHRQQSAKELNCGAACFAMLLEHYKMRGKMKDITAGVSGIVDGELMCSNANMVQYALSRKLSCCIVTAKDPQSFMSFCLDSGYDLIALYHSSDDSEIGHFSVISYVTNDSVFLNDPLRPAPDGINYEIPIATFCNKMRSRFPQSKDSIKYSNTFILVSKEAPAGGLTQLGDSANGLAFPVFTSVLDKIDFVLNPFSDEWIEL